MSLDIRGTGSLETGRDETIDGEARQVVRSPEQVTLSLPLAGPASRMLAYAIDLLAIWTLEAGLLWALVMSTSLLERFGSPLRRLAQELSKRDPETFASSGIFLAFLAILLVLQLVVEWGYFVFWEMVTGGRSPGKAAIKLRVVRDGGLPISFQESLVRNLLRMVDMLPGSYVVGLIAMVISKEGKRLGDLAAGTIVIRLDRPEPAPPLFDGDSELLSVFRFNREQIDRIGVTERALLRQTLRRLETLPPETASVVLDKAVEALRARIGYEPVEAGQRKAFLQALLRATRTA